MRLLAPVAALAALVAGAVAPAFAGGAVITVNSAGDWSPTPADVADCLQSTNTCTLRGAIAAANQAAGPETIQFAPSVTGTIALTQGTLTVTDDLVIQGPGASALAIDGSAGVSDGIIQDQASTLTVSGLTLQNGTSSDSPLDQRGGGGIQQLAGDLTVSGVTFTGNTSGGGNDGGAIYADGTSTTITGSTFTSNHASGGIEATSGGAIYLDGGLLAVSGSTFSGNAATTHGGAIEADAGTLVTITGSTFTSNQATIGAAIELWSGELSVSSSNFSGNVASGDGAAIDAQSSGTVTISGTHVTSNTGGAIRVQGTLDLSNSVIESNTAPDYAGVGAQTGYLLAVTITGNTITDSPFECESDNGCTAGLSLWGGAVAYSTITGNANSNGSPVPTPNCLFLGAVTDGGGNTVGSDCTFGVVGAG